MTLAATRRYALALSGVIGLAAALVAVAFIALVLGSPERVVLAMNEQELSAIVRLLIDGLTSAAVRLLRFVS